MIKLKNILAENMRRFGTKNLNEDLDQNNNGYPDGSEGSNNSEFLELTQALENALNFQTDNWNSDPGEDIFLVDDESNNSISVELLSGPWRAPALKAIKMVLKKFPNFIIDTATIHKDSEATEFDIVRK